MSRTAYLIISDLHMTYKNKDNRIDYLSETSSILDIIVKIADKYKESSSVKILFLGDIVDGSYKDLGKAIWLNNFFVLLNMKYDGIYSVVGNHEFSYYKDNPFWMLFNTIESTKIKALVNKSWQPLGLLNLVHVVDKLEDGNVVFHFNHHPCPVNMPMPNKTNIGLFHKDLCCKEIIQDMKMNLGLDIWDEHLVSFDNTSVLDGYDYAFFGHMHKVYGVWNFVNNKTNFKTKLYYLASVARPNHTEVQDNFLERNIPVVIVEDGEFIEIQDNKFNLKSREDSVKALVVKQQQEVYQERKEHKELFNYLPETDNPIANIQTALSSLPSLLEVFNSYIDNDTAQVEHDLLNRVDELQFRI